MNWACRCILRYIVYQQKRETPSSSCVGDRKKSPVSTVNNIYMPLLASFIIIPMKLFWIAVLLIVFLKNLPLGLDKKSRNWYLIIAYFRSSSANSEFRYLSVSFCRSLLDLPHTSFPELFQSRDYLR